MRLSISNIAWETPEDEDVVLLLNKHQIDAIDIAPSKYFPDPTKTRDIDIMHIKQWWADYGIEIVGMQSLLFGTSGLNIFGDGHSQNAMLNHLQAICHIGAVLGAKNLVFGSPKNRDRSALNDMQALNMSVSFFQRLSHIAQSQGVVICLEPTPKNYGGNFMTNSTETREIVLAVNHPSIQMQFDTGALTINQESPSDVLECCHRIIGHVHASEPQLVPLGDGKTNHCAMHQVLREYLPNHTVTIEVLATKNEPHTESIQRSILCAKKSYQSRN